MKRSYGSVAAVAVAALVLAGCGDDEKATGKAAAPATQFPLTFDNCGRDVTLKTAPERVLTIGTPAVDALYHAGASRTVAARAGEYKVPATGPAGAAVRDKPIIADEQPTLESVIGAKVDMVIGYGLGKTTAADLDRVGIAHYVLTGYCGSTEAATGSGDGAQLTDVEADQSFLGRVFSSDEGSASAADLKARIAAVRSATGDRKTAAPVYFLGDAAYTYGRKATVHDQMKLLGLRNVFAGVDQSKEFNVESLIDADPDVIVLIYGYEAGDTFAKAKRKLLDRPGVGNMKAVKGDAIVGLTGPQAEASPIAVDGLERMAQELADSGG